MDFGVFTFPTDYTMDIVALGREAEQRGFESLWLPEHTHIPASRESPWPGGPELPREYSHCLDPFVALAAVAGATSRLRLGTGICLVVEHDPITLAKQISTLDHISGGRFLFGVGGGWNLEEMRNHGTDPARRFRVLRERVQAMKQVWTQDEASYHGEFVNFDRIWSWPKPVQRPHPPIVVGGDGANTLKRVADYGDEWMPIVGRRDIGLAEKMAELNRLAGLKGRGPIPVTAFGVAADPREIERMRALGVHRCIFNLPNAGDDRVMPAFERLSGLMAEVA